MFGAEPLRNLHAFETNSSVSTGQQSIELLKHSDKIVFKHRGYRPSIRVYNFCIASQEAMRAILFGLLVAAKFEMVPQLNKSDSQLHHCYLREVHIDLYPLHL